MAKKKVPPVKPPPKPALEFKRGVVDTLATCTRKTWTTKCGKYKVEEHAKRLGGLPKLYYALTATENHRGEPIFEIIGTHSKRSIAEETCRKHYRAAV